MDAVAVGFLVGLYLSPGLLFALSSWGRFEPAWSCFRRLSSMPNGCRTRPASPSKAVCAHYAPTFATPRHPRDEIAALSDEQRLCLLVVAYADHALLGHCVSERRKKSLDRDLTDARALLDELAQCTECCEARPSDFERSPAH